MIDMLAKAIKSNDDADTLAMTCAGTHCLDLVDQLACDADNICRDLVRRHGKEIAVLLDRVDELHAALSEARKWIGDGPLSDSDGLPREYWTPEYIAVVDMVDAVLGPNASFSGGPSGPSAASDS